MWPTEFVILSILILGVGIISINNFVLKLSVLILLIISGGGGGLSFLFGFLSNFFSELSVGGLLVENG